MLANPNRKIPAKRSSSQIEKTQEPDTSEVFSSAPRREKKPKTSEQPQEVKDKKVEGIESSLALIANIYRSTHPNCKDKTDLELIGDVMEERSKFVEPEMRKLLEQLRINYGDEYNPDGWNDNVMIKKIVDFIKNASEGSHFVTELCKKLGMDVTDKFDEILKKVQEILDFCERYKSGDTEEMHVIKRTHHNEKQELEKKLKATLEKLDSETAKVSELSRSNEEVEKQLEDAIKQSEAEKQLINKARLHQDNAQVLEGQRDRLQEELARVRFEMGDELARLKRELDTCAGEFIQLKNTCENLQTERDDARITVSALTSTNIRLYKDNATAIAKVAEVEAARKRHLKETLEKKKESAKHVTFLMQNAMDTLEIAMESVRGASQSVSALEEVDLNIVKIMEIEEPMQEILKKVLSSEGLSESQDAMMDELIGYNPNANSNSNMS
jgi:hypothetical protein